MMGESTTCFFNSFSQPASPALEVNQVDPISALTSSISFGRYVSESLEWDKWSTFTHNRYKEEAERYSKPGSVAEMKAYFEAHYKKKAADRAAALNKQQNSGSNLESILETENHMDQAFVLKDNHVGTGETGEEVAATEDVIVVSSEMSKCIPCEKGRGAGDAHSLSDENSCFADQVAIRNQNNFVEVAQLCESIPNSEQKGLEDTLMVKAEKTLFADHLEVGNPARDVESHGTDAGGEKNKMPINAAGRLGDSGSLDKDKSRIGSSKSRNRTGVPYPPVPPKPSVSLQKAKHNNANLDSIGTGSLDQEKLTIGSTKSSNRTGVPKPPVPPKPSVSLQKGKHNNVNLDRKGTDMADRKRTMSRLLHLSSHSANETKKPMSPILAKILNSRLVKTLAGKASKVSRGKPVRDSVDSSIHAAAAFEDKKVRHRSPLHQSISKSGKEEVKSETPFVRSESPGACRMEVGPPVIARSLSFKSEERAAKRKEFFERLEQKAKVKMTEKEKLQQTKDQARNDPKRKSESSKTSSNAIKKVSTAVPCSCTVGRKNSYKLQDNAGIPPRNNTTLASTRTPSKMQENNSRSPWRHSTHTTTLPCSVSGSTRTPSKLQDTNSRSPWRHSTLACSSSAGTKTPSELQDNVSRSPWNNKTLPYSSIADRKTPSKVIDNNSRSPWRHTPLPSSPSVDWKTPSRVQDNNSRPPWRLATKGNHCKETIEKNNRSPFHPASSLSKRSTHENSSPNIQLSRES